MATNQTVWIYVCMNVQYVCMYVCMYKWTYVYVSDGTLSAVSPTFKRIKDPTTAFVIREKRHDYVCMYVCTYMSGHVSATFSKYGSSTHFST